MFCVVFAFHVHCFFLSFVFVLYVSLVFFLVGAVGRATGVRCGFILHFCGVRCWCYEPDQSKEQANGQFPCALPVLFSPLEFCSTWHTATTATLGS